MRLESALWPTTDVVHPERHEQASSSPLGLRKLRAVVPFLKSRHAHHVAGFFFSTTGSTPSH